MVGHSSYLIDCSLLTFCQALDYFHACVKLGRYNPHWYWLQDFIQEDKQPNSLLAKSCHDSTQKFGVSFTLLDTKGDKTKKLAATATYLNIITNLHIEIIIYTREQLSMYYIIHDTGSFRLTSPVATSGHLQQTSKS